MISIIAFRQGAKWFTDHLLWDPMANSGKLDIDGQIIILGAN